MNVLHLLKFHQKGIISRSSESTAPFVSLVQVQEGVGLLQ